MNLSTLTPYLKEAVAIDVCKRFYVVLNLRTLSLELANVKNRKMSIYS